MTPEDDPVVREAMLRREIRELRRIEETREQALLEQRRYRKRWVLRSMLPAVMVLIPLILLSWYGWPLVVFIVLPFMALPLMIVSAVKLVPCVWWAQTRWERIVTGIVLFFLVLLLNGVVFYAVAFLANLIDWLMRRVR